MVSFALSPEANAVVNRWLDLNSGWGKSKLVGTLIERFARMPESVQQIMLGRVPEDMRVDYAKKAAAFFEEAAQNPEVWQMDEEPFEIPAGKIGRIAAKRRGEP